jgi:hypothetical protein
MSRNTWLFRRRYRRMEKDRQRRLLHAALLPAPKNDTTWAREEIQRLKDAGKWMLR